VCNAHICDKPQFIGSTGPLRPFGERRAASFPLVFSLIFTSGDLILLLSSITVPSRCTWLYP
jgi:hypothetical protein